MRKLTYVVLSIALLSGTLYLSSCGGFFSSGGILDRTDPILPSPDIKEGTVDPKTNAITIAKDNISVTVDHWSRTRLNRKYTTVDMRSPFYYLETWEQGFWAEVFHITVKNDTPRNVVVVFKESTLSDDRKYVFRPIEDDYYRFKFVTKKMMDLKTKRGLEILPQITLAGAVGPSGIVPPGEERSGFVPFGIPSTYAEKVWLNLLLEKEPEVSTGSYEPIEFKFDYIQDVVLRKQQPPVKR